jgi:hypothetical protein
MVAISRKIEKATTVETSQDAPKAVVAFEVSRAGVVSVRPSDLLKTDAAKSQIKALAQIRLRARNKAAA